MDHTGLLTSITFAADVERVRERKQRAAAAILNYRWSWYIAFSVALLSVLGWWEGSKMAALSARCIRSIARVSVQISVRNSDSLI